MTIITKYKIKNIFSNLEDHITTLKSLDDVLTFKIVIFDSMKLLSLVYQNIKTIINYIGKTFLSSY
jgi:hypothetical protein